MNKREEKKLVKPTEELSNALNQTNQYLPSGKTKNLSEFDLESFRVLNCNVDKNWFRTKVILMYHSGVDSQFIVKIYQKNWFNEDTQVISNLSWLEALELYKEQLK